jgi:hypothetical protein
VRSFAAAGPSEAQIPATTARLKRMLSMEVLSPMRPIWMLTWSWKQMLASVRAVWREPWLPCSSRSIGQLKPALASAGPCTARGGVSEASQGEIGPTAARRSSCRLFCSGVPGASLTASRFVLIAIACFIALVACSTALVVKAPVSTQPPASRTRCRVSRLSFSTCRVLSISASRISGVRIEVEIEGEATTPCWERLWLVEATCVGVLPLCSVKEAPSR